MKDSFVPNTEQTLIDDRVNKADMSEADAYQLEIDISAMLARNINDHEVSLLGNPGDVTAEPPQFP